MPQPDPSAEPVYFASAADFGRWLATHADRAGELIVGYYKRDSGRPSITWPESVDEALCHGWIDGVRSRIDDQAYKIRFTPRKPSSTWSAINIARVAALQQAGRMTPAGLQAFAHRQEARSRTYAYEQVQAAALAPDELTCFKADAAAWHFFKAQPPSYRHRCIWRIVSAKRAATRHSRLARLIATSAQGLRL